MRRPRWRIEDASPRMFRFFRLCVRYRVPVPVYYWLLDQLTDNAGWRPFFMQHPEFFGGGGHD